VTPTSDIEKQDKYYVTKVNMNFNFHQKDIITKYKTFLDAFFEVFFIFPICAGLMFFVILLLNTYDFFVKISHTVHKDYVDEKHLHRIRQHLKNLTGFREEVLNVPNS
jgi:hypothetical protein